MSNTEIEEKLNELYRSNGYSYMQYVANLKNAGYKVFRNSENIHKVRGGVENMYGGMFQEIFGSMFGGNT